MQLHGRPASPIRQAGTQSMVKCAECGLLTFRDTSTGKARDADERARSSGSYLREKDTLGVDNAKFLCYSGCSSFSGCSESNKPADVVASIKVEIECDSFRKWIPAKTAKEHEEMSIVERVERLNDQRRQEDIARQERWNAETEKSIGRRFRISTAITLIGVAVSAVVAFIVAVLSTQGN